MSNLSQFIGQYSNAYGVELYNNGYIDMSGSRINNYIALEQITNATIDVTTATNNSYLSVESYNKIQATTPQGVKVNFPSGIPQLLSSNNLPQGIWLQYLRTGVDTTSENAHVTYGRANVIPVDNTNSSNQFFIYKASLAVTPSVIAIVFATRNSVSVNGSKIWLYNTDTKVLGTPLFIPDSDINPNFTNDSMGRRASSIYNLFPVSTTTLLMTVSVSAQSSTLGTLDAFGSGAIALLINTSTLALTRGPVNQASSGYSVAQISPKKGYQSCWVQVSPTNYLFTYMTAATNSSCRNVLVNATTGAITYSSGALAMAGIPSDFIAVPSINSVMMVSVSTASQPVFGMLIAVSGSSTPTATTNGTLISAIASYAFDTASIIQINTNTFMCVAGGGLNNNTWTFRSFTVAAANITPGTEYRFNAKTAGGGLAKDFASFSRTDIFKNRFGERGPGVQYIPSTKTLLIPRDGSVVYNNITAVANNTTVMAVTIDGTVITVPGDNLIPDIPGQVLGTGQYMLFPDRSSGGLTQVLVSNSAGAYSQGRKLVLDGFNTTVEATNFVNDQIPLNLSYYWSTESFIINSNFAFGRARSGSDLRLYPLEKANRYTPELTTGITRIPEVALTLNGSTMLTSSLKVSENDLTTSYILDGCI